MFHGIGFAVLIWFIASQADKIRKEIRDQRGTQYPRYTPPVKPVAPKEPQSWFDKTAIR